MMDDQAALAAVLDQLQARLKALAQPTAPDPDGLPWPLTVPPGSMVARVQQVFQLSDFELGVLLLPTLLELYPALDEVFATLTGDPQQRSPTWSLALATLPTPHWDAISPDAPLRRYHLIQLGPGEILSRRPITIEERVLHALMGITALDVRLQRRLLPLSEPGPLPPTYAAIAQRLAEQWRAAPQTLWQLDGTTPLTRRTVAATIYHQLGLRGYCLNGQDLPTDLADQALLRQLWAREVGLSPVALVVELSGHPAPEVIQATHTFLERVEGPVLYSGDPGLIQLSRPVQPQRLPALSFDERLDLWQTAFGLDLQVERAVLAPIAAQFKLDRSHILATAQMLQTEVERLPTDSLTALLWQECRQRAGPHLSGLIQPVKVQATLTQLVLPEVPTQMLQAIIHQVQKKAQVHYEWGFAERSERGAGTSVIFAGPSGTGKTMAAEAIAAALSLDLYRIDLSAVVSKYIGETEENLRAVFDAAEMGGAILLFDEADALFGKRTEVRDSHDRHANIEVSYLLQRMEDYEGLAILTTNLRKSIDDAFLRRMQFIVDFPFPDKALRQRIWTSIFPEAMPRQALDCEKLAQLSVAGGNIASIARNGAYLAAADDAPVTMAHLLQAARLEYAKLGRTIPVGEIRGWG